MDYGWLNIGSLVFGLIAWILPLLKILTKNKKHWTVVMFTSFSLCSLAVLFQSIETNHRVFLLDFWAIDDTYYAILFAEKILIGITILLNLIMLLKYKKREI